MDSKPYQSILKIADYVMKDFNRDGGGGIINVLYVKHTLKPSIDIVQIMYVPIAIHRRGIGSLVLLWIR